MKTTNLFTYGTLKPGGWNHRLIEKHVRSSQDGCISGVLVNLGMIPALIPGEGIVRGCLLEVENPGLEITDRLEGHDRGFYCRVRVCVTLTDGSAVEACAYQYASPTHIAHLPRLVMGFKDHEPIHEWTPER